MLRSQRESPTYNNYRCSYVNESDVLNSCSRNIKDIRLLGVIGEGTSGIIHKAEGKVRSKKGSGRAPKVYFAVKIMELRTKGATSKEVDYSYYMSEVGLGPTIYDTFYF